MVDQPQRGGRGLVEEQEDAAKEAFNGTAQALFGFGPGGRQTGAILLTFRVPGNDGGGVERLMDPGDEAQAPVGGVQADDMRVQVIQAHGPFEQRTGKGRIMNVGGGGALSIKRLACADQPTAYGGQGAHHKERFWDRCISEGSLLPLLGGTLN